MGSGRWRGLEVGAGLLALGCPEPPPPEQECPVEVTLGDGLVPFRAREDGEVATIVHGPQGGFHIEASVRASGLPSPWTVHLVAIEPESGRIVSDQRLTIAPAPDPWQACAQELPRTIALLDVHELSDETPADFLDGRPLRLEVEVVGADGAAGQGSVSVICAASE